MGRWLLRILTLLAAWEAVEWMVGGGFCLAVAALEWRVSSQRGSIGVDRSFGVGLFATLGVLLVGRGLWELASLGRGASP